MTDPVAKEAREQARAKTLEKHEQLCELSRALAVLASASVRTVNNYEIAVNSSFFLCAGI